MSRTDSQFKLRMPPALRSQIQSAANAAYRSINAELIFRLEGSFSSEVLTDENHQRLPTPTTPRQLRLLCLLVGSTNGQPRSLPVHTLRALPPRACVSAKWSMALPAGFVLRETRAVTPSAEVLARCARLRQASALRASLGFIRAGGLSRDL